MNEEVLPWKRQVVEGMEVERASPGRYGVGCDVAGSADQRSWTDMEDYWMRK